MNSFYLIFFVVTFCVMMKFYLDLQEPEAESESIETFSGYVPWWRKRWNYYSWPFHSYWKMPYYQSMYRPLYKRPYWHFPYWYKQPWRRHWFRW